MTYKKWLNDLFKNREQYGQILQSISDNHLTRVNGLMGSSLPIFASHLLTDLQKSVLVICKDDEEAANFYYDLQAQGIDRAYYFPSINISPYQTSVINENTSSERLECLKHLLLHECCIITASIEAVCFHITPKEKFLPYIIDLKKELHYSFAALIEKLTHCGYSRVKQVAYPGEFAVRGDIIDIYYSSLKNPIRLEFFDNQIESIRSFNPETQKSDEYLEQITIIPHKEIVYGESEKKAALHRLQGLKGDDKIKHYMQEKIENFQQFDGEHFYLRLFYEKKSLIHYFDDFLLLINDRAAIKQKEHSLFKNFDDSFHDSINIHKPKLELKELLFSFKEIYSIAGRVIESNVLISSHQKNDIHFETKGIPVYLGNIELFNKDLEQYLARDYKVILFTVNEIQANRLKVVFKKFQPQDDRFNWSKTGFSIYPLFLTNGFILEAEKIIFLNDYEIFGKRKKISKHFYTRRTENIDSFMDLKPGDYVVHIHHGIGQFQGIDRINSMGVEKDYISILYADQDKIFIPIEQLNFVQKYSSGEISKPRLDRIGAKNWSKTKERVKKSVDELAVELVKLYSYRLKQKGVAFQPDTPWQKEFEAKFPYEETEDQLLTIEEVKRDMESLQPMDRLICGDVGFGKTEVAIRASFKAVMSGKQVVMLVPTTILAEQHYETFDDRLRDYPIKVEMLSRFRTAEQQKKIIEQLYHNEIDIIIGTHRLLSKDIQFKNPGILIIDEEHRFGVKHKEKIKQMKKNLDCLSMTATPIPRTLHMSLSKIRDMSIINTPPKERLPVETYVMEFNEDTLIRGINREIERSGQVFFLYNRVKTIYEMKAMIQKLVPRAKIVVAHGQMDNDTLEDIIHSFINYEYDVLLTTTIIESGIDIPRVNTIFIDRCDRFGLAQLYQLRGRVGRSNKKAYAYLFYTPNSTLTEDAMKRLRVISEYTELGSGFKIAMKDLEIRGAGNLLGPEQHGDILAVGFSLYCKLLSDSIRELQKKLDKDVLDEMEAEIEVFLDLEYTGFIPDSYISDPRQKIEIYKKISAVVHKEEIAQIQNLLEDRFGKIPREAEKLLQLAEIRILCREMKISELIERSQEDKYGDKTSNFEIKFNRQADINFQKLMQAIAESKGKIFLNGEKSNSIFFKLEGNLELEEKGREIKTILKKLV